MAEKMISFRGALVTEDWPGRLREAQDNKQHKIKGKLHDRIPYSQEVRFSLMEISELCHDCTAKKGELHVPGCDVEECPICNGQSISCECDNLVRLDDDEEKSPLREVVRVVASEMANMQQRLHDAGLHETAHAVNAASQKLGWEAAQVLTKGKD